MLIPFLFKVIYFYLISVALALLEIQIEGKDGWAAKLPTWRARPDSKIAKFYAKIMSDKELTGYHFILNIFLLLFMHWPFIWNWSWNIYQELEIMSLFMLFVVVWDFLWFIMNPHFSLENFGPANVWWHKKWTGRIPTDYFFGIGAAIILFLPEILNIDLMQGIYKVLILLGVNAVLTFLIIKIDPYTYKI